MSFFSKLIQQGNWKGLHQFIMPIKATRVAEVGSLSARAKILSALGTGEWMNFRKSSKGGKGGHFQSKNLCCRFWTFTQVFLVWIWRKNCTLTLSANLKLYRHKKMIRVSKKKFSYKTGAQCTSLVLGTPSAELFTSGFFIKPWGVSKSI